MSTLNVVKAGISSFVWLGELYEQFWHVAHTFFMWLLIPGQYIALLPLAYMVLVT